MKAITFKVFLDERDQDVIRQWMTSVKMPMKCQAKMDRWVRYLEVTRPADWSPELIKPLKGHQGIYELRIDHRNVEYRPLGCFGPNESEFTLLVGAIEKDWKLIPSSAPETAKGRCALIKMAKERVDDY